MSRAGLEAGATLQRLPENTVAKVRSLLPEVA
jgi:hypothetical protein